MGCLAVLDGERVDLGERVGWGPINPYPLDRLGVGDELFVTENVLGVGLRQKLRRHWWYYGEKGRHYEITYAEGYHGNSKPACVHVLRTI